MPRRSRLQQRMFEKKLFYGDNLRILRMPEHFPSESVDLVYLDPPFKPNEQYNVLFRDQGDKVPSASQVRAFEDTWQWGIAARDAFNDVKENAPYRVRETVEALHTILGFSNMFAYLAMMTPRLVELRRVMKPSGSIYLHCDPAASHYLKLLMDAVFGPENFRNEIVWQRVAAKGGQMGRLPANHDVILAFRKSDAAVWNELRLPYDPAELDEKTLAKYCHLDESGRRFRLGPLLHPEQGKRPNLDYELMGVRRTWRWSKERMEAAVAAGRVIQTGPGRVPQQKMYLDEQPGRLVGDVWTDIGVLNSQARERLGYPTQKPEALLERIIAASSNEGDVVLDPFCGCGTTIGAAEKLGRYWLGIDVTFDAIPIIRDRLAKSGLQERRDFDVWGLPETVEDAARLAQEDPYQFQWWAVRRLDGKEIERKKGADKGVDGRITLVGDVEGRFPEAVISVKAGRTGPVHVRELAGTMQAQKVEVGVLVVLRSPTKAMREAAEAEGGYPGIGGGWCPRIQILTAEDIIKGVRVMAPASVAVPVSRPASRPRATRR